MVVNEQEFNRRVAKAMKCLSDGAIGPMLAANIIVEIVKHWPEYRDLTDYKDPRKWVFATFGHKYGWFRRRAEAYSGLTPEVAVMLEHDAAAFVFRRYCDTELLPHVVTAIVACKNETIGQYHGAPPISKPKIVSVLKGYKELAPYLKGKTAKRTVECPACKEKAAKIAILEAQLAAVRSAANDTEVIARPGITKAAPSLAEAEFGGRFAKVTTGGE